MRPLCPEFRQRFFPPGVSGNPKGRPPGMKLGRGGALAILDSILQEEDTKAAMRNALRRYILQRPVAAFKTLVMPLLPKDVRVDVSSQRVVVWRSFMDEVGMKPEGDVANRPLLLTEAKEPHRPS